MVTGEPRIDMAPTIVSSQEAVIVRAQVIGQAEPQVLVIVRAGAPVLAIGQVAAAPEHALAAAELERVPVAAAPERGPVAVPLRTKSVIVVHHHGRVPLLTAVEDLAVVAQTMREQAAAEVGTAWEAAATAVVVVVAVAVEAWAVVVAVAAAVEAADAVEADAGDKGKNCEWGKLKWNQH
jgi:hypothetical protein